MRAALKLALRFLVLVVALTLVSAVFSPPRSGMTPYPSGLSDLTVSAAYARPVCQNKKCVRVFHSNLWTCNSSSLTNCILSEGATSCDTVTCL